MKDCSTCTNSVVGKDYKGYKTFAYICKLTNKPIWESFRKTKCTHNERVITIYGIAKKN